MFAWIILLVAVGYIGILFAIAYWGDKQSTGSHVIRGGWVYPLSLAVYCTSWTYFGSVGLASRQGLDFIAIYLGPIVLYGLMFPLILHVRRLAREHNITSIADFLAARYGKSQEIAALASMLLLIGMLPYIALQLKAVSSALIAALAYSGIADTVRDLPFFGDLALLIAVAMASFAVLFGTRHTDATEHQNGLMLAIAAESIVKLICFLIIGIYVCYVLFDGYIDIFERATVKLGPLAQRIVPQDWSLWTTMLFLAFVSSLLLPRMFHSAIVENRTDREIHRAAWLFPFYLVAINIFVLPIALAGMIALPQGWFDSDMFVIGLPLQSGHIAMTIIAFIGGLSAATAMVILACVSLAIMISNGIIVPALVRYPRFRAAVMGEADDEPGDISGFILTIRRVTIFVIMLGAYLYYRLAASIHLASFGLMAFAAVAQLAPAFFLGLVWRRGNARGAIGGLVVGGAMWAYTLLLPSFISHSAFGKYLLMEGPFGLWWLRPQHLLGLEADPLVNGTFWSTGFNLITYVALSLTRPGAAVEQQQADMFVDAVRIGNAQGFGFRGTAVTVGALQEVVARYLGRDRTELSFASFARSQHLQLNAQDEANLNLIRFSEHLLASAIGAASSRLVLSVLLRQKTVSTKAALKLLDDASAAIQYDRDVLQAALEHARQGLSVFSAEGRLQFWNRSFLSILHLPTDFATVGLPFQAIVAYLAERDELGTEDKPARSREWIERMRIPDEAHRVALAVTGVVLEIRSARMPDGGMVTTFTDITASVRAAEELERANETLEQRVRERTEELTRLNTALASAKAAADEANLSKTRFLAAASHDVLQPLNAARLYTTSLVEQSGTGELGELVHNIDASLEAVEEILGALLDMSRLDSGTMRPEWSSFRLDELMKQLALEFAPIAAQKNLRLSVLPTSLSVRSDRRLLRRLLQNLVSNAIKYTAQGRVVVGCRRRKRHVVVEVWDSGIGIPQNKRKLIFQEFQRLETGAKVARGLGLGLSIVDRIARILDHPLSVTSEIGRGSVFRLTLPLAATIPRAKDADTPLVPASLPLTGLTVMAIDNEEAILHGMTVLLAGWGCQVMTAPDALKAIDAVRKAGTIPDALIADYHLDDGNGIEAIVHLRWRFGTHMPAVLVTADRSPSVRDEAREKDIHLLNKPLKPAALRALLTQWKTRKEVER